MSRFVTLTGRAGALNCDTARRTIAGLAVPYGPAARTMLGDVTFAAGAIRYGTELSRIKLLIGHDNDRPVGYAATLEERSAPTPGLYATFTVPAGPAGDAALAEAANGLRDALSVGVDLDDQVGELLWNGSDGPVAAAGTLREISLCALPAFDDARVLSVAAARKDTPMEALTLSAPTPDPPTDPSGLNPSAAPAPDPATAAPPAPAAAPPLPPVRGRAHRDGREFNLQRMGQLLASANRRDPAAVELLEFALTDVTTANWTTPPAYISELAGVITIGRPLIDAFTTAPLPKKGQKYSYPKVGATPAPDMVAGEKVDIPTGPVSILPVEVPVQTIAWGNDVSIQAIERSDPEFLSEWFALCGEYYARKCDLLAYNNILANAGTPVTNVSAAALLSAVVADARAGMRPVNVIVGCLGFRDAVIGSSTATTLPLNVANKLDMIVEDPNMPNGTVIAGSKDSFVWRENPEAPARLQAVNVGLLGYDLGIYGYAAYETRYPASISAGSGAVVAAAEAEAPAKAAK